MARAKRSDAQARRIARQSLEPMGKMNALGARGLGRLYAGDEEHAARDLQDGLDVLRALQRSRDPPVAA